MTSLQRNMKCVFCPHASSGFTTAYCESSPSPVSPTTRNETSSRSVWSSIRSFGSFPASRCISIQRRRSSLLGSPKRFARIWFRDCQRGTGLIQEKDRRADGDKPTSWHRQPAPASESREEFTTVSAPVSAVSTLPSPSEDIQTFL